MGWGGGRGGGAGKVGQVGGLLGCPIMEAQRVQVAVPRAVSEGARPLGLFGLHLTSLGTLISGLHP